MDPKDVSLRECRDNEKHPKTFNMILGLDETGSMGNTPHMLIKDGLPKLMSGLVAAGIVDASLCFVAIGDHRSDRAPFQIGQFESGDEQLDQWLERTYLEGNGGNNGGESYLLAMAFAAFMTASDNWDKRGQRGLLMTIGDEHPHMSLPKTAAVSIFGDQAMGWWESDAISAEELLRLCSERYRVCHIHVDHGHDGPEKWEALLGAENVEVCQDINGIPDHICLAALGTMREKGEDTSVPLPETQEAEVIMEDSVDNSEESVSTSGETPSAPTDAELEEGMKIL